MNIIIHEANGLQIGQRHEDGYINLTKMAQANGKKLNDYLRLETTKAFLEELSMDTGIPVSKLTQIRKGKPANLQGTWGHPQVAINCGQWCSPKFAVLVSKWVVDWMLAAQNLREPMQSSPESSLAKAYMESTQALNRVIHTAIHQQSNSIRDAIEAINHQNTISVVRAIQPAAQSTVNVSLVADDLSNSRSLFPTSKNSPSKTRRDKGLGSGSIQWKTITIHGKDYPQPWYHYEFWQEGSRLVKKSKYIPKRLLASVLELDAQKVSVREILKLLGVTVCK
jgi:hypothetical protein